MTEPALTVRLNAADNVVVARRAIGDRVSLADEGVTTTAKIPAGHKIATAKIANGAPVRKYNQIIGFANADILPGDHVHVHNCVMADFDRDYAIGSAVQPTVMVAEAERDTFMGFVRKNGRVGTRNYIGILSSVNCSASVCRFIQQHFPKDVLAKYPNVDGVVALTHSTGCGMADRGEGFATLQRTLWGYARHPNFAGVIMIGLGCEVNQIDFLLEAYQLERGPLFQTMTMQDTGGTRKTVERATAMIEEMLPHANEIARQRVSAAELSVALQCGGSDAYSGITANPALGYATDLLVAQGGTGILAETPEIYGAEHLLTQRAVSESVANKLIERIHWWEHYTASNGGEMNNNPSPGNKAGRAHDHPGEVAGGSRQGWHDQSHGRLQVCRAREHQGLRLHGQPRLRSGLGHRSGRLGRQYRGVHHRPRLLLRLQAGAVDQARHQHADVRANGGGHGPQLRRHPGWRCDDRDEGARDPGPVAQGRLGRAVEVRGARHRRPRVHPVADRRGDVTAPAAMLR